MHGHPSVRAQTGTFDDYCRKVSAAFYPMEVRSTKGDGPLVTRFSSERRGLYRLTRGSVRHVAPIIGARSWRNIDTTTPDEFILVTPVSTSLVYKQFNRVAEVPQGGNVLLDARNPYEFERRAPGSILCHHLPGLLLRSIVRHPEDLCAIPIAPIGLGAVIQQLIGAIWRNIDEIEETDRNLLMSNVANLLPAACLDKRPREPSPRREPHLLRVTRHIEKHLDDPNLSAASIAISVGLSASHLHAIARTSGITIGRLIQTMRLERCARDLRAADGCEPRVTEVAFRWGFSDAAHFSRAFRRHFGMSPKEFRTHHRRDRASADRKVTP